MKTRIILLSLATVLTGCSSNYAYRNLSCLHCYEHLEQEEINLAADALFHFDRYQTKDLLPKGKQTLTTLANKLKNNYIIIKKIELTGHTDRMGNVKYNEKLGLNRAKTVKSYLSNHGVKYPMFTASAGENEPVTDGCYHLTAPLETATGVEKTRVSDKLRACLQPDRRVVVKITGIKKAPVAGKSCNKK